MKPDSIAFTIDPNIARDAIEVGRQLDVMIFGDRLQHVRVTLGAKSPYDRRRTGQPLASHPD